MKALFVNAHPNGALTVGNFPMKETGAETHVLEVDDETFDKAFDQRLENMFDKETKKLSFKEMPKPEEPVDRVAQLEKEIETLKSQINK